MHYVNYGYQGVSGISIIFSILYCALILAGIISLLYWVFRRSNRTVVTQTPSITKIEKTPIDILKERYAKGEVTPHEYEQIKKDLES